MAAVAFDTLKAARRLIDSGMPASQAEAQAEVMAEAFVFNMDSLVTQDYLDARFGQQEAWIEKRFVEQGAQIEKRFLEQDAKFEKCFAEQDSKFEKCFAEQDSKFEKRLAEQDAKFDKRFTKLEARLTEHDKQFAQIDVRFTEQCSRIDVLSSDMNGKFRLVFWMLTALIGTNAAMLPMIYQLAN